MWCLPHAWGRLLRTWVSNRRWRSVGFFVGDEPKGHDDASGPSHESLNYVGIGDGEESATGGVDPDDTGSYPDGGGIGNTPNVAGNGPESDEIPGEEHEKAANGGQGDEDFDDLAVALGEDIGQREDFIVVDVVGEEYTVEDETESESNGNDGAVVKAKLVGQIGVPEDGVGVDRLGRERHGYDP